MVLLHRQPPAPEQGDELELARQEIEPPLPGRGGEFDGPDPGTLLVDLLDPIKMAPEQPRPDQAVIAEKQEGQRQEDQPQDLHGPHLEVFTGVPTGDENQDNNQGADNIVGQAPFFIFDSQPRPPEAQANIDEQQQERQLGDQDIPFDVESVEQMPAPAAQGH